MDARIGLDSEERRLPPSFDADLHSSTSMHHDPTTQRDRGSSQSDGRELHAETPPQHHLQPRSSPAAASVDSFSSYINKDAPLFQNRSSSPRAEDQLRDHSDPASHAGSPRPHPRHLVTTPIVSRDAFRHQHWPEHDLSRSSNGVMSIEHLHTTQLPRPRPHAEHAHIRDSACDHDDATAEDSSKMEAQTYHHQHVAASPSPAIDVNRLSVSNLAQKDQEDDAADPTYRDAHARAPASILADDSFESTASVMGEDAKNEIRRRRRTRPDEANLLAQVYAKNPFPDHETRLFLANRVGMSVRAVSVWFQNRRQAEKKRSGRYGGSGIAPTTGATTSGTATPAVEESPLRPPVVPSQRKPLSNASANAASPAKRFDPEQLKDLSSNNKENIPPWLAGRDALEKIKREVPLANLSKQEVIAPRSVARDLRQAVGPEGIGISAHRAEVDIVPVQQATSAIDAASTSKSSSSLSRHRSVPRLSLEDVLSGRSKALRRSATDHAAPLVAAASSEVEEEQLDTILPPPKLLSRVSSSSSLSLLTTSGGRASIGNMGQRREASPLPQRKDTSKASLTSSLPPKLTAALQRQGIIAMHSDAHSQGKQGQGLLQMMPSSSASSSEADAFYTNDPLRRDSEEDEERTLKLIAQRRAAKAQAAALAKAQEARERAAAVAAAASSKNATDRGAVIPMDLGCADARQAIVQQASCDTTSNSVGSGPKKGSVVIGLAPARQLSLDWAAGRDRASTSALPNSIGGTPLSRSVSARQLSMHRPNESTPIAMQRMTASERADSAPSTNNGDKQRTKSTNAAASRRSLSATDLTRRLQEAKRKGDSTAANRSTSTTRKRPAAEVQDENVEPSLAKSASAKFSTQPAKRRKAQLDDVAANAFSTSLPAATTESIVLPPPKFAGSMASPMLTSRPFIPHSSFPSTASRSMIMPPSTPQSNSTALYSGLPLSTRSDRFRAIGASPAAPTSTSSSLGRSISANYPSHRQHLPRQHKWEMAGSHTRTYSGDDWRAESLSQPLPLPASTPSRVLGDRSNFSITPRGTGIGNASGDSPFIAHHDDSGFFEESFSDAEELVAVGKGRGGKLSPRKKGVPLRNVRESGDDHQAAELLLGLGKRVGSRDSSSSQ
ncbi:uncharacterized protein UTRI_00332 [Ustilago trichophora]|uniref:Homeobox domain-containing protein n=1 Tax=Ustilago trichophora TaxID=86804 RepID=A0A5C3DR86_9BASI|nr:uncharacterized protein UTRI_00332 [Ustilago trichophora]